MRAASKVERFWEYRSFNPYVCPLSTALPLCQGYEFFAIKEWHLTRGLP